MGVSLALVHSEKGMTLWDSVQENVEAGNVRLEECIQPQLCHPALPSPRRAAFWRLFQKSPGAVFTLADAKLRFSRRFEFPLRLRRMLRARLHRAVK